MTDHLSEMMAKADHWRLEALRLRALINATADCLPGCDSAGHVEDCTNGDPLAEIEVEREALRAEVARLRAEVARLRAEVACSTRGVLDAWRRVKRQNPRAKMVRINIDPNTTSQVRASDDVLLVGGFSDAVFDAVAAFQKSTIWVETIEV